MFYSQTFLARKGPLGTVWCAAHLQNRLKKSHYASTDIPSTVDRIMFPEVPIALRMSGHLLLGVVRIYSKKVDYLFHDCRNALSELSKVCTSIQVNLSEEASQATVEAITLPETFDLEALELDDDFHHDRSPDNHLRSQEDITLTDQIPTGRDTYVAITFDEDIEVEDTWRILVPDSAIRMEEDIRHQLHVECGMVPEHGGYTNQSKPQNEITLQVTDPSSQTEIGGATVGLLDPGPSAWTEVLCPDNQTGINGLNVREQAPGLNSTGISAARDSQGLDLSNQTGNVNPSGDVPPCEIMRDAPRNDSPGKFESLFPNEKDHETEPPASLEQVLNGKEFQTPSLGPSGGASVTSQQRSHSPAVGFEEQDKNFLGNRTLNFDIQQSPPVQQPRQRRKRRRNFFDQRIVLPNSFIQRALEDTGDIVQKRRKLSGTLLGAWKLNHSLRNERIFIEPTITGLCLDICEMFKEGYISTKRHLVVLEEAQPELRETQSPPSGADQSTASVPEVDMGMENLRDDVGVYKTILPVSPLHSPSRPIPSPKGVGFTSFTPGSLASELSPEQAVPDEQQTPDVAASAGTYGSKHGTPMESSLDLHFLAADDNTPSGSLAGQGHSLSVRTRAVAQYLQKFSPITPSSGDPSGDLSLNDILEGKPRKLCARMFFETLVLKSHDLIDVQQQQPYGDIILKVAPLRKAQL